MESLEQLKSAINFKQKDQSTIILIKLCQSKLNLSIKALPPEPLKHWCSICRKDILIEEIITLECEHKFCRQDLRRRLSEKIMRSDFSPNDLVCSTCFSSIGYNIIQNLVVKELFEKYDQALLKGIIGDSKPQIQPPVKITCGSCNEKFEVVEIRSLDCDHKFCERCLRKQFVKILDEVKNCSLEMFTCKKCGLKIGFHVIDSILPEKERSKFNDIINKPAFIKTEKIQLPVILTEEQIKKVEKSINKLKGKYDLEIEGQLKERAQIIIKYLDDAIIKKLKKKLDNFDKINEIMYKIELPQNWGDFREPFRIVALPPEDQKYQFVMENFRKTCQHQIISISEIQNRPLFQKYKLITSEQIAAKKALNIDTTNFEQYLWHGAWQTDPELIYTNQIYGFDVKNINPESSWGKGNYFGKSASASMEFKSRNSKNNFILLFNQVFVGESLQGQEVLEKAPAIQGTNRFYDSTSNQYMVVIYDFWRAYPHYIVEFKINI